MSQTIQTEYHSIVSWVDCINTDIPGEYTNCWWCTDIESGVGDIESGVIIWFETDSKFISCILQIVHQ